MRTPTCTGEWEKIEVDFEEIRDMPHVIGAMDRRNGSLYYNYTGDFSVIIY